ncbi:hypothetical protein JKP88DRAFT_245232 [Tribonema minus]|uniref:Uncharacterized protein n=1 Tax=Tribonema minus TaxID=303371 RepID=A0A835YY82_9STRA|nr:hypothetical protein JKP88DRAFT_245232 [Tribonema minus]
MWSMARVPRVRAFTLSSFRPQQRRVGQLESSEAAFKPAADKPAAAQQPKRAFIFLPASERAIPFVLKGDRDFQRLLDRLRAAALMRASDNLEWERDPAVTEWADLHDGATYSVITFSRIGSTLKNHDGCFKARDTGFAHKANDALATLLAPSFSGLRIVGKAIKIMEGKQPVGEFDGVLHDSVSGTAVIAEAQHRVKAEHLLQVLRKRECYTKYCRSLNLPRASEVLLVLAGKTFPRNLREDAIKLGIMVLVSDGPGNWQLAG